MFTPALAYAEVVFSLAMLNLELIVGTQDLHDLVDVHLLHVVARRGEVLARIEVLGMLGEVLTDRRSHRKAGVAVDVDLADGALGGLAELALGNADRVRKLAAELVDRIDFVLRDAGGAVKNDREAGELLLDGLENVERERRRNELARLGVAGALLGLELVCAVAGADRDGERIATGLGHEIDHFLGLRVVADLAGDLILNAGENTKLGLDRDIVLVGVGDNLLRKLHVLVIGKRRAVDHDGREAGVDAALAGLESVAVVEVKNDLGLLAAELLGVFDSALGHVAENRGVGVLAGTLGDLHDHGRLGLDRCLDDGLHLLHCVEVERRDRVAAFDGLSEHLLCVDESEFLVTGHLCALSISSAPPS